MHLCVEGDIQYEVETPEEKNSCQILHMKILSTYCRHASVDQVIAGILLFKHSVKAITPVLSGMISERFSSPFAAGNSEK